jgi:hypothetical protein
MIYDHAVHLFRI